MNNITSLMIYICNFITSYYAYSMAQKTTRYKKKIWIGIAIIIPVLLLTFRNCGTDFDTYIQYYYGIKTLKFNYGTEPLWIILNLISPSERVMLFVSGFCFMSFSAVAIEINLKEEKQLAWKILLLVFLSFFINIMRQMIACSIVLIAYAFYRKKQKTLFVVAICVAFLFHKSAIFMIVLPLLCKAFRNIQCYDMFVYILAVFMPFLSENIIVVLKRFSWYSRYIHHEMVLKVEPKFLICMIPAIMFYYISGGKRKTSKELNDTFRIYISGIPLQTLGWKVIYLDRMSYYNFYFMIVLLPFIISEIKNEKYKAQYRGLMNVWLVVFYFLAFFIGNITDSYPYIK